LYRTTTQQQIKRSDMSKSKIKFDCKDRVKDLLLRNPVLRDDDNKLIATFWFHELSNQGFEVKDRSAFDMLTMMSKGELTNMQSISRARRKIQELNPELRGDTYKPKQENQSNIVEELKKF
jgi:predicted aminopeptidase